MAGRRPTYREALLRLRSRLGVACPGGLATADLEAEILLHALAASKRVAGRNHIGVYAGGTPTGRGSHCWCAAM